MKLQVFALSLVCVGAVADPYQAYTPTYPTYTTPTYTAPTYPTYTAPTYSAPTRTYDYRTNSTYTTTPQYNNSTEVRGYNYNTGSQWRTTIEKDGDMRGTDAEGNLWQYNKSTKTYINTNGKICTGSGATRVCSDD